ncbi:hypothetical protein ACJ41O_014514 [Fusarium nematophilum]
MVRLSGIMLAIAGTAIATAPYTSSITPILSCDRSLRFETLEYQTEVHAIQHLLARYPVAVDGKKWDDLESIFTPDAIVHFPLPIGTVRGADTAADAISYSLRLFVSTQHSYGTQVVELCSDKKAVALTYVTASHFGAPTPSSLTDGYDLNKVLYSYGQYRDTLVKGKDGKWRISERILVLMGPSISNAFGKN